LQAPDSKQLMITSDYWTLILCTRIATGAAAWSVA
jgi:hypothetical protein